MHMDFSLNYSIICYYMWSANFLSLFGMAGQDSDMQYQMYSCYISNNVRTCLRYGNYGKTTWRMMDLNKSKNNAEEGQQISLIFHPSKPKEQSLR